MNTYSIQLWYYDYVGDSRSPYWHESGNDLMLVSATQEEIDAWLNERNCAIVANKIISHEKQIEARERAVKTAEEQIKLIEGLDAATILALNVKKPHESIIPRLQEEIAKLRIKIQQLETTELRTILDYGYVDRQWMAEKIDIKKLSELCAGED